MATPRKKKTELAVVEGAPMPAVSPKKELILEGDPDKQIEFAQRAANALMKVVKPVEIQGKSYLQFGGWQTLGRFFGATVGIEWTQPISDDKGKLLGYEARAVVNQNGIVISSAEASCMKSERRWSFADEYAIKSMAQTRASAKALRNAFGWVAELATDSKGQNLQSTPAEEMPRPSSYDTSDIPDDAHVYSTADAEDAESAAARTPIYKDADTGESISKAEYEYSMKFYGKPLSRASQKNHSRIK